MSDEDGVHTASKSFYAALNRMLAGDPSLLVDVFSESLLKRAANTS